MIILSNVSKLNTNACQDEDPNSEDIEGTIVHAAQTSFVAESHHHSDCSDQVNYAKACSEEVSEAHYELPSGWGHRVVPSAGIRVERWDQHEEDECGQQTYIKSHATASLRFGQLRPSCHFFTN